MKIAIAATYDVTNVNFWSGIPYYIYHITKKHYNVTPIDIQLKRPLKSFIRGFYYNRIRRKKYFLNFDFSLYNSNKKYLKQLFENNYDIIITYDFFLIPFISKYAKHTILVTDATFDNLLNYYDYRSNLCSLNIKTGHALQKEAFKKNTLALLSSDWAIASAVNKYNAQAEKFRKLFYGSNLRSTINRSDIEVIIKNRLEQSSINLFFPASDWERKGGEHAVTIINKLNENGIRAKLIVAGTEIPYKFLNGNIINAGFIDKRFPEQEAKLIEYYKASHFLIMPTKADCTPVVFSEAHSFALPVITSKTGGIQSVINEQNNNGVAFDLNDNYVEQVFTYIITTLKNTSRYCALCYSCYDQYQKQFDWCVGERTIVEAIESLN